MPSLAEQMAADALEAMRLTRKYFVAELDYSPESLSEFEALFAEWHYAMPGGKTPENIDKLVRVWGAYLGEVIRRSLGGEWTAATDNRGELPALAGKGTTLFPHERIHQRLAGESAESLVDYYVMLRESL